MVFLSKHSSRNIRHWAKQASAYAAVDVYMQVATPIFFSTNHA